MPFDIIKFLDDYRITYKSKGSNIGRGWIGISCPFCGDTSFHGGFNLSGEYYYCWRCGSKSLRMIIEKLTKDPPMLVFKRYEHRFSFTFTEKEKSNDIKVELPGSSLLPMHKTYLRKRGLDPDFIEKKYKIQGGGYSGEWSYRILIPVYQNNILVTYQGRAIHSSVEPRYKTLATDKSIIDAKHCLYGKDFVVGNKVVVVEGIFDCWKLGDGAVCTLGTTVTDEQIRLLSKYKEVIFLFDPEGPAQERAQKAAQKVSTLGCSVSVVDSGLDHDPGDYTPDEVSYIRKELGMED